MVTLEVRFRCDVCGVELFHHIRIGPNFFLGADQLPPGWRIETSEYVMRCFCPRHA